MFDSVMIFNNISLNIEDLLKSIMDGSPSPNPDRCSRIYSDLAFTIVYRKKLILTCENLRSL